MSVIKDKELIKQRLDSIQTGEYFHLMSPIEMLNDRPILVGSILLATRLQKFRLYAREDDLIFYRVVKRWSHAVSYNENTLSLPIGVYHFLIENKIRLVFSYFIEESKLAITPSESFVFESCLSRKVGYLRRSKLENSAIVERIATPFLRDDYVFLKTLFAEKREHVSTAQSLKKEKAKEIDINQRGLFE